MSVNQPEETLTKFEQELTQAMRAVDPPEGFAERVMRSVGIAETPRAKVVEMPRRRRMVWASGAIAAAVLAGVFVGQDIHARHQREQAELARQQAELARQQAEAARQQFEAGIRITDETLDRARAELARAGIQLRD
jgi:type II secretory pathway component PulM